MSQKPVAIICICCVNSLLGLESFRCVFYFLPWLSVHFSRIINNTPTERGIGFEYMALAATLVPTILTLAAASLFIRAAISVYQFKRRILNLVVAVLGLMICVQFLPHTFAADLKGETLWGVFRVRVIAPFLAVYFIWAICYLNLSRVKKLFE